MCGIVGAWYPRFSDNSENIFLQACLSLSHRGPDDNGVWSDDVHAIRLGHTRLSILDLMKTGHQPMVSKCKRYVMTFNGEIYNYKELRKEIESIESTVLWSGGGDSEVLLAVISKYGVEKTLVQLNGMFAIAVWDRVDECLTIARDRIGEKPLYYGWISGMFVFASELKAISILSDKSNESIDRDSLAQYMRLGYIPAPRSIYNNIHKLLPGHYLKINNCTADRVEPVSYWNATEIFLQKQQEGFGGSERDAINSLDALLHDSINLRIEADVPVGSFLSGGYDSSLVTALMQSNSMLPINTFSIGNYTENNEAIFAKEVSSYLGTNHTELYISAHDAQSVIPMIPQMFGEPFADSSQIPTFLVSKLAREKVKVALSGDGGDELFGGYTRYQRADYYWKKILLFPLKLRKKIAGIIQDRSNGRLRRIAEIISSVSISTFHLDMLSAWRAPSDVVINSHEPVGVFNAKFGLHVVDDPTQMMFIDALRYLPDDILTKVDRTSMSLGLEVRAPLLDHRIVELAWQLPLNMKLRKKETKWILRKVLYQYLPQNLMDRPKEGFGVPIGRWIKGPLREWAEWLLSEKQLINGGYLKPDLIRKSWNNHLSGYSDESYKLWYVLMFQAWLQEN